MYWYTKYQFTYVYLATILLLISIPWNWYQKKYFSIYIPVWIKYLSITFILVYNYNKNFGYITAHTVDLGMILLLNHAFIQAVIIQSHLSVCMTLGPTACLKMLSDKNSFSKGKKSIIAPRHLKPSQTLTGVCQANIVYWI